MVFCLKMHAKTLQRPRRLGIEELTIVLQMLQFKYF
jgi:hypothetical protein